MPELPPMPSDAAAAVAAPPRIISSKPRNRTVDLEWPIEYEGRMYDRIVVRRMSTAEVVTFVDAARQARVGDGDVRLPMFDTVDGTPVPLEVIDALDPDDAAAVNEAVADFLPRSLRPDAPRS